MTYIVLGLLSVICAEMFFMLQLPEKITAMATVARGAVRVLASSDFDDAQKEAAARKGSLDLLRATLAFLIRLLAICVVAYLAYLLAVELLPGHQEEMLRILVSPTGLLGLTGIVIGYVWLRNAVRRKL